MSRIVFQSSIDPHSSYSLHLFALVREFGKMGFERIIRPISQSSDRIPTDISPCIKTGIQPEPIEILLAPLKGHAPTTGKRTIRMFSWESTRIPAGEVALLNQCACCVVPSNFVATVASACGVTVPIVVVPLGTDQTFHYWPPQDQPFTFACAGNPMSGIQRKGLNRIIRLFQKAFPDEPNVALNVKTADAAYPKRDWANDNRITMQLDFTTEQEVETWLAECHCFINFATGGWELWAHQAMACGRPVLGCAYGGMADYFAADNGIVVAHHLVPAGDTWRGNGLWSEPDEESAIGAMRYAFTHQEACEHLGVQARGSVCNLSWGNSCRRLAAVIAEVDNSGGWFEGGTTKPEQIILSHYAKAEVPQRPDAIGRFVDYGLMERANGLGDCLIMSPFPAQGTGFYSASPNMKELTGLIPAFRAPIGEPVLCTDHLQTRWSSGNGHFIQRLHRALGFNVPTRPTPMLNVSRKMEPGRIAIHLTPGRHVAWQKKHVHPHARKIYPDTLGALHEFANNYEIGEVGLEPSGLLKGIDNWTGSSLHSLASILGTCEYFIGIMSGPLHVATAMGCKCIVIVNFPTPEQIILPTLKAADIVEMDWFYPQHVHLHQEGDGPLVKKVSYENLVKAMQGEIYPFWSDEWLGLINQTL